MNTRGLVLVCRNRFFSFVYLLFRLSSAVLGATAPFRIKPPPTITNQMRNKMPRISRNRTSPREPQLVRVKIAVCGGVRRNRWNKYVFLFVLTENTQSIVMSGLWLRQRRRCIFIFLQPISREEEVVWTFFSLCLPPRMQ